MRVVYTDPAWALDAAGRVEPARADLEREIYGGGVGLELGRRRNGGFVIEGSELQDLVDGADAVVVYRCQVTPELLEAAGPNCRVVARQGVGLDNLNVELLRERGLYGFHVPDYCGDEVSSHALALALALERGVCVQDRLVKGNRWDIHAGGVPRRTCELTAGIVGFGRIGRATARKVESIYGRTIAYDPYVPADLMASYGVGARDKLSDLMRESDLVLLHSALTPETENLIGGDALAEVKSGLILVNTARGRLVDAAAVHEALEDGRLGGFASDVFSPEDPNRAEETRALLSHDRVIVTAHRAFLSQESERSLRRRIAEGVSQVLEGGYPPPDGRVA